MIFNILDYGAVNKGENATSIVQSAIDACT